MHRLLLPFFPRPGVIPFHIVSALVVVNRSQYSNSAHIPLPSGYVSFVTGKKKLDPIFAAMNENLKKFLKEWGIILGIVLVLYFTGLYRPVMSFMQQMILSTGIIKPDTSLETDEEYIITDYQWTLQTLDGQPVQFESLKGKVVFLNFFATWCPPCIAEMPGIQDLYESVDSDKIVFMIISRDDSREKPAEFMTKKGYTLPVYMSAGPTPPEFQSTVLPTTFIISPRGEIVSRHTGMADYNNDKVKNFLEELTERL